MADCCKIVFHVLAGGLILLGLILVSIGFYGPSNENLENILDDMKRFDSLLKAAFYTLGVIGLVCVGLAVLGIFSVCSGWRALIGIFCIIATIVAVLLLVLCGLTIGAIYLRTKVFKNFWRPRMQMWSGVSSNTNLEVIAVHELQMKLECCGLSGEDVYEGKTNFPASCCNKMPYSDFKAPAATVATFLELKKELAMENYLGLKQSEAKYKRQITIPSISLPTFVCSKSNVKAKNRPGCDRAQSETFIRLGETIASFSLITAVYLIAVVVIAWCVKKNED